jgi:Peptidase family S41
MYKLLLFIFLLQLFLIQGCVHKPPDNPLENTVHQDAAVKEFKTLTGIIKRIHPSLHLYISANRFQFLSDSLQSTIKDEITVLDLYNKYAYFVNEIGCLHTSVDIPGHAYDTLQNRNCFFPYSVKLIDGKLIINTLGYDLPEGTEIKQINGVAADRVLQNLAFYTTIDGLKRYCQTELAAEDFGLYYFFKYGPQKQFSLTVTDTTGTTRTVTEAPINLEEWNTRNYDYRYYFDPLLIDYDLSFTSNEECAVLRLSTFEFQENEKQRAFENFCRNTFDLLSRKKTVKRLVIDLRENTGGDLYNCFLLFSYLAPQSFQEYEKVVSRINHIPYPELLDKEYAAAKKDAVNKQLKDEFVTSTNTGYYIYADTLIQTWSPQKNRFAGQVYVITNARVASAASYFSLMVKNSKAGKIVGEETAGSANSGNGFSILQYVMPASKIKLLLPYAHMIYTYKEPNMGQGVRPDYPIPDNFESFKKNKDRQIAFINDSLNKN